MSFPATVQTSVSQHAISKVTRLFNGSLSDILNEMLQNSRRAGALKVEIETSDVVDNFYTLTIKDDGKGIADPSVILRFGDSDWNKDIKESEDPAGMGVFSLAGRNVTVSSRAEGADTGWAVSIPATAWENSTPIPVETIPEHPIGTIWKIEITDTPHTDITATIENCCRYYPLDLTLNGETLERANFLEGAFHTEEWAGCRFAIFKPNSPHRLAKNINFHGLTLKATLPTIKEVNVFGEWTMLVEIDDCPQLRLVLPSRKEVVQNEFFEAFKAAGLKAIFNAIKSIGKHQLSYTDWEAAKNLGVDLPSATPLLHSWAPANRNHEAYYPNGILKPENPYNIEKQPMLVSDMEVIPAQLLYHAVGRTDDIPYQLFEAETAYSGYGWYDALPSLDTVDVELVDGDARIHRPMDSMQDCLGDIDAGEILSSHFDEIILTASNSTNPAVKILTLNTDLHIEDPEGSSCIDTGYFYTLKDRALSINQFAHVIQQCLYMASDSPESDSWETQESYFATEARQMATTLLLNPQQAGLSHISDLVENHLKYSVGHDSGRAYLIGLRHGQAKVIEIDPEFSDNPMFALLDHYGRSTFGKAWKPMSDGAINELLQAARSNNPSA